VDTDLVLTTDDAWRTEKNNRRVQDYQDIRQDMRATVEARRDLGPEYESALIESFVSRLEAAIAQRPLTETRAAPAPRPRGGERSSALIVLGSMGLGIPLTTIAAAQAGTAGLLLAWGGIIVINFIHVLGRRPEHR